MEKLKIETSLSLLQKIGKTLISVLTVMPAVGIMISIGKILELAGSDIEIIYKLGTVFEAIGWAIINNLPLLFAAAIGGTWSKEKAGGVFSAIIAYIIINVSTGVLLEVTATKLASSNAVTHTLFGSEIRVKDYFISVLGFPALNMGIFAGILSGFIGSITYNKYSNFNKFPDVVSFFNGKHFVQLAVIIVSFLTSIILTILWPVVQTGVTAIGTYLVNSSETSPILAPFLYGLLEKLLLPFGLHHLLSVPINYTALGGAYTIVSGISKGTMVYGQDPMWLAWVSDLSNLNTNAQVANYTNLLYSIVPGKFKIGQMLSSTGLLMGIGYAMYKNIDIKRRASYKKKYISSALTVFLTGLTEPLEFMFMFSAVPLYIVYSILQSIGYALSGFINMRLSSLGMIEFSTRLPMTISAGLIGDVINFLICSIVLALIGYIISSLMISKFNLATLGRNGNYIEEKTNTKDILSDYKLLSEQIIKNLGGKDNIKDLDACMTRLRITVNNPSMVSDSDVWKSLGATGSLIKENAVQIVYGPKADAIKTEMNNILNGGNNYENTNS